eukprot:jgi/Bigna1/142240/aug1.68_g16948
MDGSVFRIEERNKDFNGLLTNQMAITCEMNVCRLFDKTLSYEVVGKNSSLQIVSGLFFKQKGPVNLLEGRRALKVGCWKSGGRQLLGPGVLRGPAHFNSFDKGVGGDNSSEYGTVGLLLSSSICARKAFTGEEDMLNSTFALGLVWVALCTTLVLSRHEDIKVFISFLIAISVRITAWGLLSLSSCFRNKFKSKTPETQTDNQILECSLVGAFYATILSSLALLLCVGEMGIVNLEEESEFGTLVKMAEHWLLICSTGYLCMYLFDQLMNGLVVDSLARMHVVDSGILLSTLTAQFHRDFRIPLAPLLYSTFFHHLFLHIRNIRNLLSPSPSLRNAEEQRINTRISLLLFKGIPRMMLLVQFGIASLSFVLGEKHRLFRESRMNTVEVIGTMASLVLLNAAAVGI